MSNFQEGQFIRSLGTSLYQQVYLQLRSSILSRKLKSGVKLPSTRALAEELVMSRNTILSAYQQLVAEGYADSVAGSGTYVARVLPEHL
jgi:GntR family transcriptional regulator / MocR family aminotransferase